jgi:CBS-domain-containing membrane protein
MRGLVEKLGLESRLKAGNLRRYVLQCALAGVAVLILLLVLDALTQTVLIAALGSSTFIAFAVPQSLQSDPRYMIGGYLVGITSGCLMSLIFGSLHMSDTVAAHTVMVFFGALATALAMFFMVVTKTEHPPAAALALGLVLNPWDLMTLFVVITGVVALSIFKQLILPMLMDLL